MEESTFIASADYQEVRCNGYRFRLGPIQAQVVRALHEAAQRGEAWQSGKVILSAAGSKSLRMSERQYAAHLGLSRGAIQKAKRAGRLVLFPDESIDAEASDRRRAETTDLSKSRPKAAGRPPGMKPVPAAVIASANETLRENGVTVPEVGEAGAHMKAKTFNEIMKAQERKLGLQIKRGELVDRSRATSLVFRLAREERDAWVNWPARRLSDSDAVPLADRAQSQAARRLADRADGRADLALHVRHRRALAVRVGHRHRGKQPARIGMLRIPQHGIAGALFDHLAKPHHHHAVRHAVDHGHVVADEQK